MSVRSGDYKNDDTRKLIFFNLGIVVRNICMMVEGGSNGGVRHT